MKDRGIPTNLDYEPSYPNHETVLFSIRFPDLICHSKKDDCKIEEPHNYKVCGIYNQKAKGGKR